MNYRLFAGATLIACVAGLAIAQNRGRNSSSNVSGGPTTVPTTGPVSDRDTVAVIVERNMFMRDRVRRNVNGMTTRPSTTQSTDPALLVPEKKFILRGVVYEDDTFHAYFENTQSSEMVQASVGTRLARGTVIGLTLDAVVFENDGIVLTVDIGDDLTGARVGPAVASSTSAGGSSASSQPAGVVPGSIEERMRARRARQTGG